MSASMLTPGQARAAQAPGSVAVTAGAGTGKTHMLTERYVHHVRVDGFGPLQIVAATFTDRAAAELRSRIRARLVDSAAAAEHTAELEAAQIGTLHSLAGRICREHPEAAGVPFDFAVQDALEQRLWRERYFADAIRALPARVGREIPFRTLVATVRTLLDDPYTADQALRVEPDTWPELIASERERLYRALCGREEWRNAVAALRAHAGPPDDKMEAQRAAAVAALDAFAASTFTPEACAALDTLNAGRGSKKAWGEEVLSELKRACIAIREGFREGKHAFTLELGEADEILARAHADVRRAFELVRAHLLEAKRAQRVLDFNDLEVCALRALRRPEVQDFYRTRWKAFLIDEFQDTNPVQAELLALLAADARVTVVGDEKQSIYGFRRADVRVFRNVRRGIRERGGDVIELARSFRAHACLIEHVNAVVRPALADLHQPLEAERVEAPGEGPFLRVFAMAVDRGVIKDFRRRAEAHLVGDIVEAQLHGGAQAYDKRSRRLRPVRPGDIAVLARTWNELEPFGVELAARGIPVIHAGGGDLFGQREVKDGVALLRFLADETDDLALAAVLRSPFFAVEDVALMRFAERLLAENDRRHAEVERLHAEDVQRAIDGGRRDADGERRDVSRARPLVSSWWAQLVRERRARHGEGTQSVGMPGSLAFATEALSELREHAATDSPSALLGRADACTAYTATIANLPGGPRRLADWRGLVDLVRTLERGHESLFAVVRQLGELIELEGSNVPRPAMEAGDAVSLMTVHNAKGLEWPVVILPDSTASGWNRPVDAHFDPEAGVAFRVRDSSGEEVEPALFKLLAQRAKARDAAEEVRVLYVALTRARDRLFLTANEASGGKLDQIADGLREAGIGVETIAYRPENAVPRTPRPAPASAAGRRLLDAAGHGLVHLPATSITTFAVCPRRFEFELLRGHPGAPPRSELAGSSGSSTRRGRVGEVPAERAAHRIREQAGEFVGRRIGDLTHRALEKDIASADALRAFDETLDDGHVARALELADVFRTSPVFAGVRSPRGGRSPKREKPVSLPIAGVQVHGIADLVGDGFVLDYKTGEPEEDGGHALQVAIYAHALNAEASNAKASSAEPSRVDTGYIAYLRADGDGRPAELVTLGADDLAAAMQRVRGAVDRILDGDFTARPEEARCRRCPFEAICSASALPAR